MYYHLKNWVDWLSIKQEKMLQSQNVQFQKRDQEIKKHIKKYIKISFLLLK